MAAPLPAIGVLISGRGSNLQALIDAVAAGDLPARIAVVISNRPNAAGLERARAAAIETLVLERLAASGEPAARPIGAVVAGAGNVAYR